jgi:hypothetical protein
LRALFQDVEELTLGPMPRVIDLVDEQTHLRDFADETSGEAPEVVLEALGGRPVREIEAHQRRLAAAERGWKDRAVHHALDIGGRLLRVHVRE